MNKVLRNARTETYTDAAKAKRKMSAPVMDMGKV
jgi:hypothetical protein